MPTLPDLLGKNLDTNGGDGVHQGTQPLPLATFDERQLLLNRGDPGAAACSLDVGSRVELSPLRADVPSTGSGSGLSGWFGSIEVALVHFVVEIDSGRGLHLACSALDLESGI
jgi:hypothetical protein